MVCTTLQESRTGASSDPVVKFSTEPPTKPKEICSRNICSRTNETISKVAKPVTAREPTTTVARIWENTNNLSIQESLDPTAIASVLASRADPLNDTDTCKSHQAQRLPSLTHPPPRCDVYIFCLSLPNGVRQKIGNSCRQQKLTTGVGGRGRQPTTNLDRGPVGKRGHVLVLGTGCSRKNYKNRRDVDTASVRWSIPFP